MEGKIKLQQRQIEEEKLESKKQDETHGFITDTFAIKLRLQENILCIFLEDYISWKKYQKSYTREIFSRDVNSKIELQDIFYALKRNSDEIICSRQTTEEKRKIWNRSYNYGDIFYNQFSEFQIEKDGKLTVFSKIIHVRGQKSIQKIEKSCIEMDSTGSIDDDKIFQTIWKAAKEQIKEQYEKQIQGLKRQIQCLKVRLGEKKKRPKFFDLDIRMQDHDIIQMKVSQNTEIKNIKKRLRNRAGIEWDQQMLEYDGKQLKSSKILGFYGINKTCQICLRKRAKKQEIRQKVNEMLSNL